MKRTSRLSTSTLPAGVSRHSMKGFVQHYLSTSLVGLVGLSVIGVVLATTHESVSNADSSYQQPVTLGTDAQAQLAATSTDGVTQQPVALMMPTQSSPTVTQELLNSTEPPDTEQPSTDDISLVAPAPEWTEYTIEKGDSVSVIFDKQELHSSLNKILADKDAADLLSKVIPGKVLRFKRDDEGLQELQYDISAIKHLSIKRREDGSFDAQTIEHEVTTRRNTATGTINSSLFMAGKDAGISDSLIMELVDIFAYDIDFALDIREGDNFKIIYDERFANGEKIDDGAIVAAEFSNNGNVIRALRFETNGTAGYYTPDGKSLRKAFIRTPVKFTRISSGFNPARKHPILHTIRAHKGVDYAAPKGTPVKTTGNGKIEFVGRKNGYGKTVIVKHGNSYSTLYAHLNSFNSKLKAGSSVKQGQIIGYVGSTGSATGPHLHYEFRVNGVHKDPLKVKLPNAPSLGKKELAAFKADTGKLLAQLSSGNRVAAK